MSKETTEWLNTNILVGNTAKRGMAWHHSKSAQGAEPNWYEDFIPTDDILRRLFNFKVEPKPVFTLNPQSGEYEAVEGKMAQVCSDNHQVLAIHSDGYAGHNYAEWLMQNVDHLAHGDLGYANAGLLKQRAVAFVQVEVADNFETPDGVVFRPNLLAATSFDGSLATTYKRCVTNVVCDNTMMMALNEGGQQFKVKHTKNSTLQLGAAREALAMVLKTADDFTLQVNQLCATTVTEQQWQQVLDSLVSIPEDEGRGKTIAINKREKLDELWCYDPRVEPWKHSAWGVLQAFNTHRQHYATVRNGHRVERAYTSALSGDTAEADTKVLKTVSSVVGKQLLAV